MKTRTSTKNTKEKKQIKVLITDNIPLYPPIQGGSHRIYHLYKPLPERFVINYLGATSHRIEPIKARINELIIPASESDKINKMLVAVLGQNKKWLRGGSLYDLGMRLVLKFNKRFMREVDKLAEESDVLIASHPWFFTVIKKHKDKALIYDSHNCEYELLKHRMSGFMLGRIMLACTKRVEKEACRKSDLILACSETDKRQLMEYYHIDDNKIEVMPNPVNTKDIRPASAKEKESAKKKLGLEGRTTVLFIATNFFANNSAADFIVDELAKKMPELTFLIVGTVKTHFDRTRKELLDNIVLFGRVEQEKLLTILRATDIAINPVMTGSGICIKSLDYMAAGLPIVSTSIGMRGIATKDGVHAVICEPSSFRKNLKRINDNPRLHALLAKNARKLAEQEFDAGVISKRLAVILEKCVKTI
jgi:glycosyltransferase involved in cell wall biosynthesis